jgi:hypothetical protein
MKETSQRPCEAAAVIWAEVWYSTIFAGTPRLDAAALPSSTVTPVARPV